MMKNEIDDKELLVFTHRHKVNNKSRTVEVKVKMHWTMHMLFMNKVNKLGSKIETRGTPYSAFII